MIAYLKGKIISKCKKYVILETGGVGYKIYVNDKDYADLKLNEVAEIYTHQHVREDALDLYGFSLLESLEFFELLLSVSGIGPKSASGVLSVASAKEIINSISRGDASLLVKVSGIGAKTAERVVLELRGKVKDIGGMTNAGMTAGGDEIDALMALGYSLSQAREALRQVNPQIKDSGERIRLALKSIK